MKSYEEQIEELAATIADLEHPDFEEIKFEIYESPLMLERNWEFVRMHSDNHMAYLDHGTNIEEDKVFYSIYYDIEGARACLER